MPLPMSSMTTTTKAVGGVAAGAAGFLLLRTLRQRAASDGASPADNRWRAVTVYRTPEEVKPDGRLPEPLARLGDLVEVEVLPAPGGRGSELRARLRKPEPSGVAAIVARGSGDDPRQAVRAALRESKQLIEVGEVLRVDPVPHGKRGRTPVGQLIGAATKRAGGEGLL
jgi:hypothetical protein